MPHIDIEYSSNLEQAVDAARLLDVVHQTALDSGAFPRWGVRTFAKAIERFRIGEGESGNGFVRIIVRISPGRDLATRQTIARALFDVVCEQLRDWFEEHRLGCQLEIQEFEAQESLSKFTLGTCP